MPAARPFLLLLASGRAALLLVLPLGRGTRSFLGSLELFLLSDQLGLQLIDGCFLLRQPLASFIVTSLQSIGFEPIQRRGSLSA